MSKEIKIKLIALGVGEKNITMLYNSTVKDLRTIIAASKNIYLYKEAQQGKIGEVKSSQILHDRDVLFLVKRTEGEATVKCNGKIWRVHQNDPDKSRPSDFHAVDCENGEKLDLYTGKLYSTAGQYIGKVGKKNHKFILEKLKKYDCFKVKVEEVLSLSD